MTVNNCNTYLIKGIMPVLIDPGHVDLFDSIEEGLAEVGLEVKDIGLVICTHAHPDHVEAARLFMKTPALITIHAEEWRFARSMDDYPRGVFGLTSDIIAPDFLLQEGELIVGDLTLTIVHTPGHSPGSIAVYWPERKALFSGDLVFRDGVGRTDLPGGDDSAMRKSIKKVRDLKTEWLLPGHGGFLSGAGEITSNFDRMEHCWFSLV